MGKILTISIAAYNISQYISDALNSLISDQTVLDRLEVIVVNDGSVDNTLDIANEYAQKYPNTIKIIDKPNGGYGSTVNASLKVANGKYFRLLDGDDLVETDNLNAYLDFLNDSTKKMILTPYYNFYQTDSDSTNKTSTHKTFQSVDVNNPIVPTITIETEALKGVYNELSENVLYTDSEFTFNAILAATSIETLDVPIYIYRLGRNGQSVSYKSIQKNYTHHMIVAEKICSLYDSIIDTNRYNLSNHQLDLIKNKTTSIIHDAYQAIALNGPEKKDQMLKFDNILKNKYPNSYAISNNVRKIQIIRQLHFNFYNLYCKVFQYLFIKKNPHSI